MELSAMDSKIKFMELMKNNIAPQYGIKDNIFKTLSLVGYMTHCQSELFDMAAYRQYISSREAFVVTANDISSLYKHGALSKVGFELGTAIPAEVDIFLIFERDLLIESSTAEVGGYSKYILPKESHIKIGEIEYSLDYDIEIKIYKLNNGEMNYVAKYLIDDLNPIAKIHNPNINIINHDLSNIPRIALKLKLKQYKRSEVSVRYIAPLETDIIKIKYDNMLCDFYVEYTDDEIDYRKIDKKMIYEPSSTEDETIFFKTTEKDIYLLNKYELGMFIPNRNSTFRITKYESIGSNANFVYNGANVIFINPEEDGISAAVEIVSNSVGGRDSLNKEELRTEIINRNSTLGSYITSSDLEKLSLSGNSIVRKYKDDFSKRIIDTFILLKNQTNEIIPSNTLNLRVPLNLLEEDNGFYSIPIDSVFEEDGYGKAVMVESLNDSKLNFQPPFYLSYDKNVNAVRVFDKYIDKYNETEYSFIKANTDYTIMINRMRTQKTLNGKYKVSFTCQTNLTTQRDDLHTIAEDGSVVDSGVLKIILSITKDDSFVGYVQCTMDEYIEDLDQYKYSVELNSNWKIINDEVIMDIKDINHAAGNVSVSTSSNLSIQSYVKGDSTSSEQGLPIFDGFDMTNNFKAVGSILLKNLSWMMNFETWHPNSNEVIIYNVPVVEYEYYNRKTDEINTMLEYEIDNIENKYLLTEENYTPRVLFANTYGRSHIYRIGLDRKELDTIHLSFGFRCRLAINSMKTSKDVKNYIVNYLNRSKLEQENFHVSRLIDAIKTDMPEVDFIEFTGFNSYPESDQLIDPVYKDDETKTPEYLNILRKYNPESGKYEYDVKVIIV